MSWLGIIVTFALVDNVVLARLLGLCPCAGAPRTFRVILGVGICTTVLMAMSSLAAWALETLFLDPRDLGFLRIPCFVLALALLALLLESMALRISPALLRAAGFSVRGVAVNCATLGVVLLVTLERLSALESLLAGLSAGCGFLLALTLMSAIRERLDAERVPRSLRGLPLSLVSAGLVALAFSAFDRVFLANLLGR